MMQDLVSPSIKSILAMQQQVRLNISPKFQTFLTQRELVLATLSAHQGEIEKMSGYLATLSKWIPSPDTPLSVFSQVASFSKTLHTPSLAMQQLNTYQSYFHQLDGLRDYIPMESPNLEIFQQYDYTLIEEEDSEPESRIVLLDEGERIKRIISTIYQNNQAIYSMKPIDFEYMVAELLRAQQFEVEMTKQTRDGGYDLIAVKNVGNFPVRFLVECKRNAKSRKVGVDIIRGFRDVIKTQGANKGIIVTSSYFSADANKERQQTPYLLEFKDHDHVIEWVNRYIG